MLHLVGLRTNMAYHAIGILCMLHCMCSFADFVCNSYQYIILGMFLYVFRQLVNTMGNWCSLHLQCDTQWMSTHHYCTKFQIFTQEIKLVLSLKFFLLSHILVMMQSDITGCAPFCSAKNKFLYDTSNIVIHQRVNELYSKMWQSGELTFITFRTVLVFLGVCLEWHLLFLALETVGVM